MSSVSASFKQNLTRSFVSTVDNNWGVYFYAESDIDDWYQANQDKITKVTDSLYLVLGSGSGSNLIDVLLGDNGATILEHTLPNISDRKSIKDMGKEICIGNGIDSRLVVLRKVQKYSNAQDGGAVDPTYTGYVVVENNCEDLQGNSGRFTVRVARVV